MLISERTNDGLERSAEQWFRRYNPDHPGQGGARKTTALHPKAWLVETRETWAEQINQALGLMYRSNTSREQQTRAQAQAEAQRHAETMKALRLQAIASREQHEATLEALRHQGDALRTLIERTAPAQP